MLNFTLVRVRLLVPANNAFAPLPRHQPFRPDVRFAGKAVVVMREPAGRTYRCEVDYVCNDSRCRGC